MLIKTKTALAAALILGSATAGFAQGVVPEVDGDGNRTGLYDVLPGAHSTYARGPIGRSFAGPRHHAIERSFAGPRHHAIQRSFAGPRPYASAPVYSYGANGPAWERNFERWLQQD
jgi:hypothetical protein